MLVQSKEKEDKRLWKKKVTLSPYNEIEVKKGYDSYFSALNSDLRTAEVKERGDGGQSCTVHHISPIIQNYHITFH